MKSETFRWEYNIYNVSAILRDIDSGVLELVSLYWPPQAVKAYFDNFLDPSSDQSRPPLHVDIQYAMSLPTDRLGLPIVLVHVSDRGLIAYEEPSDTPHHVVADGNHRIARAAAIGIGLQSLILSREQSLAYESII